METDLVYSFGYLGIFLLIFVLPVPQELVLPLGGFIASQGRLNVAGVVLAGVMGSTVGSLPWYWAGRYMGEHRLMIWVQRYRWIKLSASDVDHTNQWFAQSGIQAVLLSQFIPIIRTLIALPAGISRMHLGVFLLCLVISAIVWQGLLASAGYLLGSQYLLIHQYWHWLRVGVGLCIAIALFWFIRRKR
jgi:membrane protein DedA with SNARE-associated domain